MVCNKNSQLMGGRKKWTQRCKSIVKCKNMASAASSTTTRVCGPTQVKCSSLLITWRVFIYAIRFNSQRTEKDSETNVSGALFLCVFCPFLCVKCCVRCLFVPLFRFGASMHQTSVHLVTRLFGFFSVCYFGSKTRNCKRKIQPNKRQQQ